MKIAVTTSDGMTVNEEFNRSSSFYIFKIVRNEIQFLETRNSYLISQTRKNPEKYHLIYNLIKDCQVLYTTRIGHFSYNNLVKQGILPIEYNGDIDNLNIID